jgi:hypothetical protein
MLANSRQRALIAYVQIYQTRVKRDYDFNFYRLCDGDWISLNMQTREGGRKQIDIDKNKDK